MGAGAQTYAFQGSTNILSIILESSKVRKVVLDCSKSHEENTHISCKNGLICAWDWGETEKSPVGGQGGPLWAGICVRTESWEEFLGRWEQEGKGPEIGKSLGFEETVASRAQCGWRKCREK